MKYIPLLQNGSKTRSGIKDLILTNTCAFDAVTQVFAAASADGFAVSTTVFSNSTNNFCNFLKGMLDDKMTKLDLYKNRARILENYFAKQKLKTTTEVTCHCSATYIFERILIDVIYSADVNENCTNVSCPLKSVTRKVSFLSLDTNKTSISEAAASMLTEENNIVTCRRNNCNGIRTFTYNLHNVVSFELNQNESRSLDEVPLNLKLKSKEYDIIGIIEYLPSGPNEDLNSIGHYTAHCYRKNKWICFDDLSNKTRRSKNNMNMHCLVYGEK
jgi:hypothetical protein